MTATRGPIIWLALGWACLATAANAAVDFKGRQLTIVIGYGVGGTYYQYAQLFSRHLGRLLPGQPGVIVQSMPGAGGVRMLNEAAVRMRADGTFIFMPPDTMVVAQLLEGRGIAFDARRFHYLGTADQQNMFLAVRRSTAADLAAMRPKEVFMGSSGKGSTGHLIAGVVRGLLGLKVRIVGGYEGSRDIILAIEKGEIDGSVQGWQVWMQARPSWLDRGTGFLAPILQVGVTPDPAAPEVPLLRDLAAAQDQTIAGLFDTIGVIGRGLAAPPDTPADHVAALRAAVAAMLGDAEYLADSERVKLRVLPKSGEEVAAAVAAAITAADAAVTARAASFLE